MKWDIETIQRIIARAIPEGRIVPRHTDKGHFYGVTENEREVIYPSVTGKLQLIKDESIINFKMKQAVAYVFKFWKEFTDENIMQHLEAAERQSADIFEDAGDIGTRIHNYREKYFSEWIRTNERPESAVSFIPEEENDVRAVSAMRALEKFVVEREYVPAATELMLYNHKLEIGGTLDDIGLMPNVLPDTLRGKEQNKLDKICEHVFGDKLTYSGDVRCEKCNGIKKNQLVLMDIKTSNQFKDHYFFQVALYYWMFYQLTQMRPERCFILKLSKKDGTYEIEDMKAPALLAKYARSMLVTERGIEYIKKIRKDNQKIVGDPIII